MEDKMNTITMKLQADQLIERLVKMIKAYLA